MRKPAFLVSVTLAAAIALTAAGCSANTPGGSTTSGATSGQARSLKVLKIGFFSVGTANGYAAAVTAAAQPEAQKLGVNLSVLSANYNVQTQVNQLQQALQRKSFNAWVVAPMDSNQECSIIQQAADSGIGVVLAVGSVCSDNGPKGGVSVVTTQTLEADQQWWDYIFTNNKPQDFALLTGDALDNITKETMDSLNAELSKHPGFKSISTQNIPSYSTQGAYKAAQDIIASHPDLKLIVCNYSGLTQGVVQAVDQAGKTGQILIVDQGGDKTIVNFVKDGRVAMTEPGLPATISERSVDAAVQWWQGKDVPKNINPLDDLTFSGKPFLTKSNVSQFTAEY